MNRSIAVEITGTSALLMARYPMEPGPENPKNLTPAEVAARAAYKTPEGLLYIPGGNIQRALIAGGKYVKVGKAMATYLVAACVFVTPEITDLQPQDYVIDTRSAVNQAVKARIVVHRPRLDKWTCQFTLDFDDALLTEDQMRKIVDAAGSRVGLLAFRPEKKGPFGRFVVTKWIAA